MSSSRIRIRPRFVAWLRPGNMTARSEFDGRLAAAIACRGFYPPDVHAFRGKTSDREDRVAVRFLEIEPARRIVEGQPRHHGSRLGAR